MSSDNEDLFAEETEEERLEAEALAEKNKKVAAEHKKNKKVVIAKTIFIFDIKVYEEDTDFEALGKKIIEITMDGLIWNKDWKVFYLYFRLLKSPME